MNVVILIYSFGLELSTRFIEPSSEVNGSFRPQAFVKAVFVNDYPINFIRKHSNTKKKQLKTTKENTDQSPQEKRATLPYIHNTSELTARILRKHNILIAHKPSNKIATYFTKHKDQLTTTDKCNAIYMFNCNDCTQSYIGKTSGKVKTHLTEHKKTIKRHDPRSIPVNHTDEQGHSFDISNTKIFGHAKLRRAREFLEAWHSIRSSTINQHIDIPETYLQLKHLYPTYYSLPLMMTLKESKYYHVPSCLFFFLYKSQVKNDIF